MFYLSAIHPSGEVSQVSSTQQESSLEFCRVAGMLHVDEAPPTKKSYWDFQTSTWVEQPTQPSEHHVFNWVTKQWEDPRTVQDFKDAKWVSIKEAREAAINAPLITPYGTFDSDPKSRQNITDAILLLKSLEDLGSPGTIDFTLADDTARTLNTAEMVMVGLLLGQKIQAAHAQARALRGALDLATTKEEVEAITWQVTT